MSIDVEPSAQPLTDGTPRRIARNTFLRASGEVVAKGASLALYVTMARELGREGFGAFMFALALTGVLLIAAGFGTDLLIGREVARNRGLAGAFLANVAAIKAVSSVALLALAVLVVAVGDYSDETRLVVFIVGIGVALEVLAKTWHSVFQGYERLGLVSLSLIVQRVLTAIVGIAVLLGGGGLVAVSVVFASGAVLGLVVAEACVRRLGVRRSALEPRRWTAYLKAGFPIGVASFLFVILLRLDVTLLSFIAGEAQVGLYAAAFRLVEGTQFLAWSLSSAMLPWLSRAQRHGGAGGLTRGLELGLKVMSGMLLPISIGFILFAQPIIDLLYGEAFQGSVLPLQVLGATCALYGVQSLTSTTFIARDRPLAFARVLAATVVLNVAANLALVPRYGADGAAVAALASSVFLTVLSVVLVQQRVGRIGLVRFLTGPLVAGAVMTVVGLALPIGWVPRALLALVAYGVTLAVVELVAFRDDAERVLAALPPSLHRRLPGLRRVC